MAAYEVTVFPIREKDSVEQVLVHTRDQTALDTLHLDLQKSENLYRTLVENLPGIVYVYSPQRGGVFWSPQVESILGYSVAYLQEHPFLWNESIHPDDAGSVANAIAVDSHFAVEYRIRDAQGVWRRFLDRSLERRVENGEVLIQGLALDITDR